MPHRHVTGEHAPHLNVALRVGRRFVRIDQQVKRRPIADQQVSEVAEDQR